MTLRDLSEKDVIQLKTGENLGRIDVIMVDAEVPPPHANHIRKGWM